MAKMIFSFPYVILVIFLQIFMAKLGLSEPNITTDAAALLQLKAQVSLDPHNFFARNWNWSATNTSAAVCNWVGVTCGIRHHKVTAINLANMGFGGTIPPHMGNLSFLASLNITGNSFYGTIPKELWHLRRLRIIDLSSNSFSGSLPGDMCRSFTRLERFNVSSNEITDKLPSSLGNCRKLKLLSIFDNKITGKIPRSIGNLTELVALYLDDNNLEGEFPQPIFNVSSIKWINVANNSLSGSLPVDLCHHQSLEELYFYQNKITGRIPKSIGNCTFLKYLVLDKTQLTGEIPHEMGNLHNLEYLELGWNNLTGLIPDTIFNNSVMEVISLNGNQLSGHLPSSIGLYLPNLQGLYLLGNNLRGIIPISIGNASKITFLELSYNFFSGLIPNTFGNCKQLELLNLGRNHLTTGSSTQRQSFYSSLTNCRYLRHLYIRDNPLKGVLPNSVGNFSTSLEIFDASFCEISGGIPIEIGNLSNMITLRFSGNALVRTIPRTMGNLQKLQGLGLSHNMLEGFIPNDLCKLESLNTLMLDDNVLQGLIPTCFDNLTSLRYLYLSINMLSFSIPSTIWSLKYILQVDFSSNSLRGSLPFEIGNLKVLTVLNLSRNQLSGYIPSSVGSLMDINSLDFARNEFQGPIPQSFGNLISLKRLDLSGNNLFGEIPKSLVALSDLIYFNVSFNRLEGEIPSGGPFANFTAESFMQNRALCGSSRLHVPPCKTSFTHKSKATKIVLSYILPTVVATMVVLALVLTLVRRRKKNKSFLTENNLLNMETLRRISYQELQRATGGFNESNLIGTGSFGSVYKARLADGMNIAVKVFNLQEDTALESFDTECEVLRRIRHRNLIKIISSCSNLDFKALILQYMPQGSLEKWLYCHNYFLNILQRLDLMIDVASALEYLHCGYSLPIIHSDLKPSNVLLDDDMVAHLGDFGMAKILNGVNSFTQTMTLATIGYMAPEYGLGGIVSTNGDVYSFGILMVETFTRKKPTDELFAGEMSLKRWVEEALPDAVTEVVDANLLNREEEAHFAANRNCLLSILSLALKCSAEIPENRMNAKDALVHLKKIKSKFLKDVHQA